MAVYCTAKNCPLQASCGKRKDQTQTDTNYYNDFSNYVEATLRGFQCSYFEHKNLIQTWNSGTTEAIR